MIGAARVLDQLKRLPAQFQFETEAGLVQIERHKMRYTFTCAQGSCDEVQTQAIPELLAALGMDELALSSSPCWVNTGSEQLLLEVSQTAVLDGLKPDVEKLSTWFAQQGKRVAVYLWHEKNRYVRVRFFSVTKNQLIENIGAGTACANLGTWCLMQGLNDVNWNVLQGDYLGRPNRLFLRTDEANCIHVGGETIIVGHGSMSVPQTKNEDY